MWETHLPLCIVSQVNGEDEKYPWNEMPDMEWTELWHHSPWDQVIIGIFLRPGQAARLPLSAEVSLRTIRSRWKRWHLAFPRAPPLPVNGCLAVSSTLELVPQLSFAEVQTLLQSFSCRAAYPSNPFVQGPICLHKQAVCFCVYTICNELFMISVCRTAETWTRVLLKRSNTLHRLHT